MISSKVKAFVVVFALLFCTSFVAVGCKSQAQSGWVNTNSMPGKTFKHNNRASKHRSSPNIVYLGSSSDSAGANFGPGDVSFDLKSLR